MKASFMLVRHGSTVANSTNPKTEVLRGWRPLALSPKGEKEAKRAGRFLEGKSITRIWHSPLKRVTQTAQIINENLGLDKSCVVEVGPLIDWNTGAMEGMLVEAMKPFLDFYQRHPALMVPEGESYQEFWDRWKKQFKDCCDWARKNHEEKLVVITHARNLVTLQHWLKKRPIGPVSYDLVPDPGGVLEVVLEDGKIRLRDLLGGEKKDDGA
jgi:broad specificity phosphatase PhoE